MLRCWCWPSWCLGDPMQWQRSKWDMGWATCKTSAFLLSGVWARDSYSEGGGTPRCREVLFLGSNIWKCYEPWLEEAEVWETLNSATPLGHLQGTVLGAEISAWTLGKDWREPSQKGQELSAYPFLTRATWTITDFQSPLTQPLSKSL